MEEIDLQRVEGQGPIHSSPVHTLLDLQKSMHSQANTPLFESQPRLEAAGTGGDIMKTEESKQENNGDEGSHQEVGGRKERRKERPVTGVNREKVGRVSSQESQGEGKHFETIRSQLFQGEERKKLRRSQRNIEDSPQAEEGRLRYQQYRKVKLSKPLIIKSQVINISVLDQQSKVVGDQQPDTVENTQKNKGQQQIKQRRQTQGRESDKEKPQNQPELPQKATETLEPEPKKEILETEEKQEKEQGRLYDTWKSSSNWNSQWNKTIQNTGSMVSQLSPQRVPGRFRFRSVNKPLRESRAKSHVTVRKKKSPACGKELKLVEFERLPRVEDSEAELISLGKDTLSRFGMSNQDEIELKKYKNCVSYKVEGGYQMIWYYEGNFYLGEFNSSEGASEKHGTGIQIHPGKYIYEGSFKKGSKEGYGRIRYQNNDYYEGEWLKGIKNGEGILVTKSGDRYQGMFLNGIRHGYGKEVFVNGDVYSGNYRHNKFDGEGSYEWSNGSSYKGEFSAGLRSGTGYWKSKPDPPHDEFNGTYINGKKNGKGVYKWANGSSYNGQFVNDLKHGQGIMRFPGGKTIRALWQSGVSVKKLYCQEQQLYKESRRNKSLAPKPSEPPAVEHQQSPLPYPRPPPRKRSFSKHIEWCG